MSAPDPRETRIFGEPTAGIRPEADDQAEPEVGRLLVRRAIDVPPETIRPIFGGRLLLGKLTAIAGDGGIGKSYLTTAIAANVSRGWPLPGDAEPFGPADVALASFEDGAGDTIRPRLDLLGADLERVHLIEGVAAEGAHGPFTADSVAALGAYLAEHPEVRLLVIDPVSAWVGAVDEHRNNEVRGALEGLRVLADRHDLAVMLVMHLTKASAGKALHRLSGSGAYGQLVRSALLAAIDPDDDAKAAVAHIKHNLTGRQPTLGYQVDAGGFFWLGERDDLDGEQLAGHDTDGERSGRDEAESFLVDMLADGPMPAKEVRRLAEEAGVAERTLMRAKKRLGVQSTKAGLAGAWSWSLPEGCSKDAKDAKGRAWQPSASFEAPGSLRDDDDGDSVVI